MDYAVALTIAKYAGAVLASLATIWSATNVVNREVDGRKRLTGAGWIAIGFIVGGLTTSLASIYLQDQLASSGSDERAAAEARRERRIILAGQRDPGHRVAGGASGGT